MPKPKLIAICKEYIEDKSTNLLSIIGLLEKIGYATTDQKAEAQTAIRLKFFVIAIWEGAPEDVSKEFECQYLLTKPPSTTPEELGSTRVRFQAEKPMQRFALNFDGPAFSGAGILRVESRLREVGSDVWLSQEYSIIVERIEQPSPQS